MINDVDETIKQLLITGVPIDPAEVDISFDMPDREWSASIAKPTINLYLYDIHENRELRGNHWPETKSNGFATRTKPPKRVDLSYLITVWTNETADQHRLLGYLLATLFRYREIPSELLQGTLQQAEYPLLTFTAQEDGILRNAADFWGALDNQLKPSIRYVITIPVEIDWALTAPIVTTKLVEFKVPEVDTFEEIVQISGTIFHKGKPDKVLSDASVMVKDLQQTARTDKDGKYFFRKMVSGSYTFEVSAQGEKKRQLQITIPSTNYDIEI